MRFVIELAKKSLQRQMAYRAANIAGLFTNLFFGMLRASVMVAVYAYQLMSGDTTWPGRSPLPASLRPCWHRSRCGGGAIGRLLIEFPGQPGGVLGRGCPGDHSHRRTGARALVRLLGSSRLFSWLAQLIARLTPFIAIINTPVEVYLGIVTGGAAAQAVLEQFLWLLVLVGSGRWILSRGTRKLTIQGG